MASFLYADPAYLPSNFEQADLCILYPLHLLIDPYKIITYQSPSPLTHLLSPPLSPQLQPPHPPATTHRNPKTMAATAHKRLLTEYRNLSLDSPEGIVAGPRHEDDLFNWECMIQGPDGTPFEGGVFPRHPDLPARLPARAAFHAVRVRDVAP